MSFDVQVVGAVIIHRGKFLLLKRRADDFMGGIYELPSGKVEAGESLEDALIREVFEETGLQISTIIGEMGTFDYLSKDGKKSRQFNHLLTVHIAPIRLTEHEDFVWADFKSLDTYNITDSTLSILEQAHIYLMSL